jgi:hypothetical protein
MLVPINILKGATWPPEKELYLAGAMVTIFIIKLFIIIYSILTRKWRILNLMEGLFYYRYHISTGTVENIMIMDKIALHVNANSEIVLVSEYDYHTPLLDSGKIISLDDKNKYFTIPGIKSGGDIMDSRFISENQLAFYTPKMLYFANLEKGLIYTYKLDGITSIQLNNAGVSFTKPGHDNTLLYYTMLFESIFGK